MFNFKVDPSTFKTINIFKTMDKRTNVFKDAVLYYSAQYVLESMKDGLSATSASKSYIDNLHVAKLLDSNQKSISYSIVLKRTVNQVKKLDPDGTLISIKAIQKLGRKDKKAAILEQFSPWTMDKIPFFPDKKNAEIISTKANKKEVDAIQNARKKDEVIWRRELVKAGAKLQSTLDPKLIPSHLRSVNDVGLEAVRLEFGLDGSNSGRQWTKAMRELESVGILSIIKDNDLMKILSDPNFSNFSTYVPKVTKRITPLEARDLVTFQKRIGLIQ